jgi:ATP-dependent DNA helicase RecQ
MITSVLTSRDVLGILPTGGGKSLVYQLASQLLSGVTVVVSPLISLMRDQASAAAR